MFNREDYVLMFGRHIYIREKGGQIQVIQKLQKYHNTIFVKA